jgi:tetratricopeptide (TPR) repeat protein
MTLPRSGPEIVPMMIRALILFALLVSTMLIAVGCQVQRPVDHIHESAEFHFRYGRYDLASQEYAAIIARYPGDWRAQYGYGLSMLELNELTPARRALELAHSLRPGNDDIVDALIEVMFRQNDEQNLFSFLRDRADRLQSVKAYRQLAHYSLEMGDPDSAKVAIRTALRLDGGQTVEPYLDAATLAERIGDMDEAVRRLRQALWIDPRHELVKSRLRELGEVPGPTAALPPDA